MLGALLAGLLLLGATPALAEPSPSVAPRDVDPSREEWLEELRDPSRFAERWGQGSLEFGRDGRFHWVRCTTRGAASPAFLSNVRPYSPPIDLRNRFLKVWVRVDDVTRLAALELRLSSDGFATNSLALPIPLYSDPEFGLLQSGDWIPITFSLGTARVTGRPDRSRIDSVAWYVEDRGEGPVRFSWGGLAGVEAPREGVVSFTFDDGYDEHFRVAAPILAEHGMRGTAYVMPDQLGSGGYMSLDDLRALRDRFGWDVAAHHAVPFTRFPADQLERTLLGIRRFLSVHGFAGGEHLALPLGKHDTQRVLPLVRKHFRTTRIAGAGPETLPPADPHRLRVLNVLASTPPRTVAGWARRAQQHGEWAILMFHYLVDDATDETQYAIGDFRKTVALIDETGVPVRTVSEVWEAWSDPGKGTTRRASGRPRAPASAAPPR